MLAGQIIMHFMIVIVILSIFRISNSEMKNMRRKHAESLLSAKNLKEE